MIVATPECAYEAQLVETIVGGRWPQGCDASLIVHAGACPVCREVVAVATALHEADACGRQEARARVPSAGLVWWRATIRARAEASRVAERPITVVQGIAGASAVGLACGVVGAAWRSLEWFQRLGDVIADLHPNRLDIMAASALILQHALPLVIGLGACLLIAPLALYLVLSDD
jgi:hypothetical protein